MDKDKYKITEEEQSQVKLYSAKSLPNNPSERGMSPESIKAFFYKFLDPLFKILNIHLEEIDTDVSEITAHLSDPESHPEMKNKIAEVQKIAESAVNLASGKAKIYPTFAAPGIAITLRDNELHPGDMIVLGEKNLPELMVYSVGEEPWADDVQFVFHEMYNYGVELSPGKFYYFKDKKIKLLALESGIDTSLLASREELEKKQDKLNATSEALYGFDESGKPTIYNIAKTIGATVDGIPTAKVVNETFNIFNTVLSEEYASKQELSQVESIAKGANQALCFDNYTEMVKHFKQAPAHSYNVGQNIMIVDIDVPDLWISMAFDDDIYSDFSDEEINSIPEKLANEVVIYIGHYRISALETQKVDLTGYAAKEDIEDGDKAALQSANKYTDQKVAELRTNITAPKVYVHIKTETIVPKADGSLPNVVSIYLDENGNSFELTDFYIKAKCAITDGTIRVDINNGMAFGNTTVSGLKSTSLRTWALDYKTFGENMGGMFSFPSGTIAASNSIPNSQIQFWYFVTIPPKTNTNYYPYNSIENIKISCVTSGATFLNGSEFELWGVRK